MSEFFEAYAEKIGLTVIASAKRGGELLEIDVLAVDDANTFIIECKWDLVDAKAIQQLSRYREVLKANQPLFKKRLVDMKLDVGGRRRAPVLVALGYRYEDSVLEEAKAQAIICLTYNYYDVTPYAYHRVSATCELVRPRRRGKVGIQYADRLLMPASHHPKVCKRRSTMRKLARLPRELRKAFRAIHHRLRGLPDVTVSHGKLVRYRAPQNKFAEAKICLKSKSIHWRYRHQGKWKDRWQGGDEILAEYGADKIFNLLRKAYIDASAVPSSRTTWK